MLSLYPPLNEVEGETYWFHLICPFVYLSVSGENCVCSVTCLINEGSISKLVHIWSTIEIRKSQDLIWSCVHDIQSLVFSCDYLILSGWHMSYANWWQYNIFVIQSPLHTNDWILHSENLPHTVSCVWYGHNHIDYSNSAWCRTDINVTQIIC